jgi:hypothetical protein
VDVDVASLPDVPEVEESAHGSSPPATLADRAADSAGDSAALNAAEASRSCGASGGEGCAASGEEYVEEDMDADWVESAGAAAAAPPKSHEEL